MHFIQTIFGADFRIAVESTKSIFEHTTWDEKRDTQFEFFKVAD